MLLRLPLPDLRSIPWFDRSDHPFVPTCRLAERRAQWKSPRRGRREAEHRAVGRLTERARRYTPNTRATARRRPARLPPRNVLDYWWGVPHRIELRRYLLSLSIDWLRLRVLACGGRC